VLAAHWEGNPNVIYCKAKGSGGANEMAGALQDSEVMYGLGKLLKMVRYACCCLKLTVNSTAHLNKFID